MPPRFPILLELRAPPLTRRKKLHALDPHESRDRHHIPKVLRHNERHQDIDLLCRIRPHVGIPMRMHAVATVPVPAVRRFHLHSPQPPARIRNKVVAGTVSIGLRHPHSQTQCLVKKREFSNLAALFARESFFAVVIMLCSASLRSDSIFPRIPYFFPATVFVFLPDSISDPDSSYPHCVVFTLRRFHSYPQSLEL